MQPDPSEVSTTNGSLDNLVQIGVGRGWACALRNDKTVWCWGGDNWGQQGNGDPVMPVAHKASQVPGLPEIASIWTTPDNGVFAIDPQGNVWAWGRDTSEEIGDGTLGGSGCNGGCEKSPVDIHLAGIVQIGAGLGPMVALKKAGAVVTWGYNSYAGLGHKPGDNGDIDVGGDYLNPQPGPLDGLP